MKVKNESGNTLCEARTSPGRAFVVVSVPNYPAHMPPARVWLTANEAKRLRKALKKAESKVKP